MDITIIDGQGGGIGKQLIIALRDNFPGVSITAVGTNSLATAAMLKAGAAYGATGENAVLVACREAKIIVGPIGIVIADSLLGEITPKMAAAVAQSRATRLLIPVNLCGNVVVGIGDYSVSTLIRETIEAVRKIF
ncbi:MAG: DUF3842 family protein [Eubacteriales bacterium]|nr:DUF3842 family protein [Eubacteriales bacterium]MDD4104460.1 DUF3842 family protein [Eubacteriales bacterium]MDD4709822.1 DUF3842 family protein [Eubacteriales bacterium]NLO15128.1 DUF3842 family protein [Clostridiales bacterium]